MRGLFQRNCLAVHASTCYIAGVATAHIPHEAIDGLTDAITLLFTQARLGNPLPVLQQTVRDVRHRIAQLFHEYVAICDIDALAEVETTLSERLVRSQHLCVDGAATIIRDHAEYCLREVMVCFELARQICTQHAAVATRQHLLADLPILRPFDYPDLTP